MVNVIWSSARDYCSWAKCELPTDEQWEVAARGNDARIYPWGKEDPDEYRANYEMIVGSPTPVGFFPDGDTPEGVADMAGNVWEWTQSDFDKNTKSVRGASCSIVAANLRAGDRSRVGPGSRYGNLGFRCVREVIP